MDRRQRRRYPMQIAEQLAEIERSPVRRARLGEQRLGLLRSINNPVRTAMAGPTLVAAGLGPATNTLQVQGTIPQGAVLWVSGGIANFDTVDLVSADGQNIYTGGPVPVGALDSGTQQAVGILIDREVKNTLTVNATANAPGTLRTWIETASLEVQQALSACACDDD
jgi:hypothetical protein